MPTAMADSTKPDRSEQMWKGLKLHILRERARKKQEMEAEVEEERLRKEREAREQQDVMTLGETKEQISALEARLASLKEEKHQLFLQLKKVLNEDDNRRRQVKENSDLLALQNIPAGLTHPQLYISPSLTRGAPMPPQQTGFKTAIKRPRSPSPQPTPVSLYPTYAYKPPPVVGAASYQNSPQKDDGRRNDIVRAVLWNKTQYTNPPSAFYPVGHQEMQLFYPIASREQARTVYETPRAQTFHIDQKIPDHYPQLRTPSHSHVIHGGSIAINPTQPVSKTGSITAGYPVRTQTQYQSAAPAALYTTQSRPLYQSPGAPMNYPPRD